MHSSENTQKLWMNSIFKPRLASVIIPTYNRDQFLPDAMSSVFSQTYRPIEMLVIDDGSTDDTVRVVEEWLAKHCTDGQFTLRYFFQENSGAPVARNVGLIESKGEFIQFLDSDDLLHPEKLKIQINRLAIVPSLAYVYSGTGHFKKKADWKVSPYSGFPVSNTEPLVDFLRGRLWNTLSGIYRRSACVIIGPWNERASIFQDWDYNIRFILTNQKIEHIPLTLSLARTDSNNRITNKSKTETMLKAILAINIEWEVLIRNAGRLEGAVEWVLAERRCGVAIKAMRYGFWVLAREAAIAGGQLSADPSKKFKIGFWQFLATIPRWYGYPLSWALFALVDMRCKIKRYVVRRK